MESLSPCFLSSGCSPLSHGALWHTHSNRYFYISNTNIIVTQPFQSNGLVTNPSRLLKGHSKQIKALCSLNDKYILSAGSDLTLRIWSACGGCDPESVLLWPSPSTCSILVVAAVVDSWGRIWIVAGDACGLMVVYLQLDPSVLEFTVHQSWSCTHASTALALSIVSLDQHHSTMVLASASADSTLILFLLDPTSLLFNTKSPLTLSHCDNWISSLHFTTVSSNLWARNVGYHQNDVLLASGSFDKLIRIYRFSFISNLESSSVSEPINGQLSTKAHSIPCPVFSTRESDPLPSIQSLHVTLDSVIYGHDDWIYSVAWSPVSKVDGSIRLASCSADQSVLIWQLDPPSWTSVARLGHQVGGSRLSLHCIQWRPSDAGAVAVTGYSGAIHLFIENSCNAWVPESIAPSGHIGAVRDLTWHPHNALAVVTTSLDQTTRIWAGASFKVDDSNAINSIRTCPPTANQKTAVLWAEWARPQIHGYDINVIGFASDNLLVSGADEKVVRVFNMPVGYALALHRADILPSPESMGMVVDRNSMLQFTKTSTPIGANLPALGLSNKPITSQDIIGSYSSNKENEYLEHQSYTVSTASAKQMLDSTAPTDSQSQIKTSAHPTWVPPLEQDRLQHTLWPEMEKLYGHGSEIVCLATHRESGLVATACKASSPSMAVIRIYETQNWVQVCCLGPGVHSLTITSIQFSPRSGNWVVSASRDRSWALWRHVLDSSASSAGNDWRLVTKWEKAHARIIWDAVWSPDEAFFVTGSRDKSVKVWAFDQQTSSVSHAATLVTESAVTSLSVVMTGKDGWYLAAGLESGTILIYHGTCHGTAWKETRVLLGAHTGSVNSLEWRHAVASRANPQPDLAASDSDPFMLASCSEDGSVRIYSTCH